MLTPTTTKSFLSDKVAHFTESVIREMTRQALMHGAVNLSQGFPDFPAPEEIKRAAQEAIAADINQYAITWGAKKLRDAIAAQMRPVAGDRRSIPSARLRCAAARRKRSSPRCWRCVTRGMRWSCSSRSMKIMGRIRFVSGATPRFVKLRPPTDAGRGWTFDERELAAAFHSQTKAIVLNTPNNPTGKSFYAGASWN